MNKTKPPLNSTEEKGMNSKIDYDEINRLIALLEQKNLSHFELEVEGFKIKLGRNSSSPAIAPAAVPTLQQNNFPAGHPAEQKNGTEISQPQPVISGNNVHHVISPMVGTFYRAPDPASPPFVEVGDEIKKAQTLCIIEAMKLMNEIEADVDGIIEEIFVENAKPVEYGQKLFSIKVRA
jgi:acetyl-CoA carboxylase biotin carboxyl carrier protein